ncbi:hypothetical protein [Staphylococcus lugdunensis]|uniref:hypothetical protein n=1 Tax=Staphylococcus lugdunensis TaxID=28035 RepID=UPI001F4CE792|nr:hypothetical protein [Staphylococcus lugdunensis]MCH8665811.1 hypothetical protein [Staphylococcus lugdunensis]
MDQKKRHLIKTLINVLPIFIVPLVTERKHIKNHSEVKKVTAATSRASKTVANKATDVKEFVIDKKQEHDNKRELKKIAKENDPEYIEKKGEKLAKKNRKEADKMDKKLQKNIEQRHKEEAKAREKNEKQRIKDLKKTQKYQEKVGLTPGALDDETEKKGEKLAKDNKHDIKKLAKKLQKNIEQRHYDEEKNRDKNKKARIKEIKKYEEHDAQSVTKQNNKETHHES